MTTSSHSIQPPYLIAELANSHGGDARIIEQWISTVGKVNYPNLAMKFQILAPETLALPDYDYYEIYEKLVQPPDTWQRLLDQAVATGADVWLDVFDRYGVDIFAKNQQTIAGLKFQASILDNHEVLTELRQYDLSHTRVMINVSGVELTDIQRYVAQFEAMTPQALWLQVGFQAYPTQLADTMLNKLAVLRAAFPKLKLCMADHVAGDTDAAGWIPLMASALGCHAIEKHVCLSRDAAPYDKFSALELSEFALLAQRLLESASAFHPAFISPAEQKYLDSTVQKPVSAKVLNAGSVVAGPQVQFRRTNQTGLTWPQLPSQQTAVESRFQVLVTDKAAQTTLTAEDFRPARIGVIVAGRMKSSRLKQKALLPIDGVASVTRCLESCLQIPHIDEVILATSTDPNDAVLAEHLPAGVRFYTGDPDDVMGRFLGACDTYNLDIILRITADCPFLCPEWSAWALAEHCRAGADYTRISNIPQLIVPEVMSVPALRRIHAHFNRAEYSEYMTWYFTNNRDQFEVNELLLPEADARTYRMTLDYDADLAFFEALYTGLRESNTPYTGKAALAWLDAHPDVVALNADCTLRYQTDPDLIRTLNEKTRIHSTPTLAK